MEKKVYSVDKFIKITTAPIESVKYQLVLAGNNLMTLNSKSEQELRQMILDYVTVNEDEFFDALGYGNLEKSVRLRKAMLLLRLPTEELYKRLGFNIELSGKSESPEKNEEAEKEQYLYHTEDLIANVLELYQQGDVSFDQLMENYLKRITNIYKMYRHYALREPGFVMSERNKEVTAIFAQLLNGYELPEKMEGIEKQEYYQSLQSGVNDYLNNKGKKI